MEGEEGSGRNGVVIYPSFYSSTRYPTRIWFDKVLQHVAGADIYICNVVRGRSPCLLSALHTHETG